jgi:hypothetical protein
MGKTRTFAACLGVLFLLALAAPSARADAICADEMVVKLQNFENHQSNLGDHARSHRGAVRLLSEIFEGNNGKHLGLIKHGAGAGSLLSEEFENNSGKHQGFTMSSHRGNKFGLFKEPRVAGGQSGGDTIPNPEPAAVFLLGTGMAAAGAFLRRRFRKSSH